MKYFLIGVIIIGASGCKISDSRNDECLQLRAIAEANKPGPGNENPTQEEISARVRAEERMRMLGCQFAPEDQVVTTG